MQIVAKVKLWRYEASPATVENNAATSSRDTSVKLGGQREFETDLSKQDNHFSMPAGDGYDEIPIAEVKGSVQEWLARNQPLSRAELNTVERQFMQTTGEPARRDSQLPDGSEVTKKNPHMRIASPEAFGVFAYEEDTVLIELDETVDCGEMVGYPAGDSTWVPLLLCVEGPASHAHERMEFALSSIDPLADGDLAL